MFNSTTGQVHINISVNKSIWMQLELDNYLLQTPSNMYEYGNSVYVIYEKDLDDAKYIFTWKWNKLESTPLVKWSLEGALLNPKELSLHIGFVGVTYQDDSANHKVFFDKIFMDWSDAVENGHTPKNMSQIGNQVTFTWNTSTTFLFGVTIGETDASALDQEVRYWFNPQDISNCTGLVGRWKMNQGNGQTAYDATANNHDGTLGNATNGDVAEPTWTSSGKFVYALDFDGSDDFVEIPADAGFDLAGNFSVEAWIYPRENAEMIVAGKSRGTYLVYVKPWDDALHLGCWANSGQKDSATSIIPINEWSHVVLVFGDAAVIFYVNGIAKDSLPNSNISTTSSNFLIGKTDNDKLYFNGIIDEVRFYNRSLSAEEILSNYRTTVLTTTSYAHYWTENTSTVIYRYDFSYSFPINTSSGELYITYPQDHRIINITYSNGSLWDSILGTDDYTTYQILNNATHQGIKIKESTISKMGNESYRLFTYTTFSLKVPDADFTYSPLSPKNEHDVYFTDKSTDIDGTIVEWFWNFGDESTSTQQTPNHQYEYGGNYFVTLIVIDNDGESDLKVKHVKISQTYELTVKVRDYVGFPVSDAQVKLYSGSNCYSSKYTDAKGTCTFSGTPEGEYQIRIIHMGLITSKNCSFFAPKTEQIALALSIWTFGISGGIIVSILAVMEYYVSRKLSGRIRR
jgi:PKD repeat protein